MLMLQSYCNHFLHTPDFMGKLMVCFKPLPQAQFIAGAVSIALLHCVLGGLLFLSVVDSYKAAVL